MLLGADVSQDERFSDQSKREDLNFSMSIPLKVADRVVGVMNLGFSATGAREPKHLLSLATIFGQRL